MFSKLFAIYVNYLQIDCQAHMLKLLPIKVKEKFRYIEEYG